MPRSGHALRRDIEGLRAVAVIAVVLYHLGVPWVPGGYAGVDVFFVVSGFLITGLLLRELAATGDISLTSFYARRARRLLPAASLVIAVTFALSWVLINPVSRPDLIADVLGSTLYVVNWVLAARAVNYLAEDAGVSPLQHYWSLSVEEQFYLLWPLLMVLGVTWARRRATSDSRARARRVILGLLLAVSLVSLVWSVLATARAPQTAYFVTTTRLWELGAGAALAFALPHLTRLGRRSAGAMALVGVALVIIAMVGFDTSTPWPGSAAILPVLGTVLVIAGGSSGHVTGAALLLGVRPMVALGGLSYGIYLWHWPVLVLTRDQRGDLGPLALCAVAALTVVLAALMRRFVEDPIRYHRGLARTPVRSLVVAGAAMGVLCASAAGAAVSRPELGTFTTDGPAALVADPGADPWEIIADPRTAYTTSGALQPPPELAREDVPPVYADGCQMRDGVTEPDPGCIYGDRSSETEVAMWGDSKIGQYTSAVNEIALAESWKIRFYTKSACAPTVSGARPDCNAFGQETLRRLLADPPHLVLISSGGYEESLRPGMVEAATALTEAGIDVVIVNDNAHPDHAAYECAADHPDDLLACERAPRGALGGPQLEHVREQVGIPMIDLNPWICPEEDTCPVAIGGQLVYRQGSHLTDTYARSLAPFLYRELSRLGLTEASTQEILLTDVPARVEGDR